MLETDIRTLYDYVHKELKGIPFDKGIIMLRVKLWEIADKYNLTGVDVFSIMMDNWSKYNN